MNNWQDKIKELYPCEDAIKWFDGMDSAKQAYKNCGRGDWLLWLAGRLDIDRKLVVLAACECAEQVLKYVPEGEERPKIAIETARKWVRGEATLSEVRRTADAVYDYAAASAAAYAAYAASAASAAAYAAAYASDYASDYAARKESLTKSADIVRKHITLEVFLEKLITTSGDLK